MTTPLNLFMLLLGCRPSGRHTEQHDIFFCIGNSLKSIVPDIMSFWPGAGTIHIDAWRVVSQVDGFNIRIADRDEVAPTSQSEQLYFLNLGGYKPGEFEEYHYKILTVANDKKGAISAAKKTAFYKHTGFKGAESHIDDKYGIDIDDFHQIMDILPKNARVKYSLVIEKAATIVEDEWHLGYTVLSKIPG